MLGILQPVFGALVILAIAVVYGGRTLRSCEPRIGPWEPIGRIDVFFSTKANRRRRNMAEDSGGTGVLGVLVGALLVVIIGFAVLYATGNIGSNSASLKIEAPKATTGTSK